ncbi:hypothetical protein CHGG_07624 [Chaetomium globosum CBS 148.51]|uniref:Uncharacterized protein n=1 Tax=Chaetomium globosum (strain ATCC 6205 / CBS 148.51 / DSM 1962 / NBRC 6347 / NRRL 1970) TaxID=306901 RepID=Q2GWN0_CHAGB|nr:uncharacterized protein CHGG_07624 [Chaetomium globosum CBS 148.51]EAQ86371.1 hypothetical protein CHGG_07624 [Chaetomium globosum CBS 148.51]
MTAAGVRQEGFTALTKGGSAPIAGLIFVYSFQGHPEKTWTYGKREKEARPMKPMSRVFEVFASRRHAEDSFDQPTYSPPVFWPLDLLAEDFSHVRYDLRDIYESTHAIIFFGTPHRGSSYTKLGILARDIAVLVGLDASGSILRSLEPDAEILRILSDQFAHMLLERSFKIHSFQEAWGSRVLISCRERFSGLDDPGYRKVKGVVSQYLDEIQTVQARDGRQFREAYNVSVH